MRERKTERDRERESERERQRDKEEQTLNYSLYRVSLDAMNIGELTSGGDVGYLSPLRESECGRGGREREKEKERERERLRER